MNSYLMDGLEIHLKENGLEGMLVMLAKEILTYAQTSQQIATISADQGEDIHESLVKDFERLEREIETCYAEACEASSFACEAENNSSYAASSAEELKAEVTDLKEKLLKSLKLPAQCEGT